MNDTPATPFAPFQPLPQGQPPATPEKPKRKSAKKDVAVQPPAQDVVKGEDTVKVPRQKRKKANGDKPVIKLDLQTALEVATMINADDRPVFEKLVGILQDAGKPGRERLLAAIGKIFA